MMRFLVLLALCFSALSTPALAAQGAKESAFDRVMRTGTLRCAYGLTGKFVFKDTTTNEVKGVMPDIISALAESMGLEVEWTAEVGYADFAEGLKTGRYDAFCGALSETPARARVAAFTSPLFFIAYYVWGREGEDRFKNENDINKADVRTATTDGEVFQSITKKHFPTAKEHSLPNMTEPSLLYVSVSDGKADVVVHDSWNISLYNAANQKKKLKKLFDKPLELYPAGFAVAPGQQDLLNALNTGILSLISLEKIDVILDKWGAPPSAIYRPMKPFDVVK